METSTFLIQLIISFIVGITILYMTLFFVRNKIQKSENFQTDAIAKSIFIASILLSVSNLLAAVNQPFLSTIKMLHQLNSDSFWIDSFKYLGLFLFIVIVLIVIVVYTAFFVFTSIIKGVKGLDEIKNNNTAVAIIVGVLIVSISIIIKENLVFFTESFVPYPTNPIVY